MTSPAFSDSGQAGAAYTESILQRLAETGKVAEFPTMNTLELYALGALAQPLLDDYALEWWNAQPDPEAAARRGYEHMVKRKMIDPATNRIHPKLGLILAARSRPAFIVLLRPRPDGNVLPGRYLGIADEEHGLRAVMAETAPPVVTQETADVGPLYIYELAGPAKGSRSIADFAADSKHVTIDFYLPGSEMSVPAQRYVVAHGLRRLRVERHTPSAPPQQITASREDLAEMLLDKMTEACK